MICPGCGEQVVSEALFCHQCGTRVKDRPASREEQPVKKAIILKEPVPGDTVAPAAGVYNKAHLDKGFFLVSLAAGFVFVLTGLYSGLSNMVSDPLFSVIAFILTGAVSIYVLVVAAIFIYQAWSLIPAGESRTTPGRAAGYLFIPLFNLYWAFQAFWGFAKDYNRHIRDQGPGAPRLPEYLFLGLSILFALTPLFIFFPLTGLVVLASGWILFICLAYITCSAASRLTAGAGLNNGVSTDKNAERDSRPGPFFTYLKSNRLRLGGLFFAAIILGASIVALILPRGQFEIHAVAVPEEVVYGDRINIIIEMENYGRAAGKYDLAVILEGREVTSRPVSLQAGSSKEVDFDISGSCQPGHYRVNLALGSFGVVLDQFVSPLRVLTPAEFEIGSLRVNPGQIDLTEKSTATVEVSNLGEAEGSLELSLKVDGRVVKVEEITLRGETSGMRNFDLSMEAPGLYTIGVNGFSEELEVFKIERPDSGTVMINELSGGYGQLRITNNSLLDVVVVLAAASDPQKPLLAVYIHGEKSTVVRRIKDGTYIKYFSQGRDWDSHSKRFTRDMVFGRFEEEDVYATTHSADGYYYTVYTTEFGAFDVSEPAQTKTVDPKDFPDMMQ